MKYLFSVLVLSLFLVACVKQGVDIKSEQSVQDIVSQTPDVDSIAVKNTTPAQNAIQPAKNATVVANLTVDTTPIIAPTDKPIMNKKCRNSNVMYGGCKWNDAAHTNFDFKIQNGGKADVPGLWLVITGESGGVKYIKRPEMLITGATRAYNIDYDDMKKEVGYVKHFDVYPIEVINGTEYGCENGRVYTIPEAYCKEPLAINVDNSSGSMQ